ncbi:hypothetical protein [Chryseobacterium koreense]
MRGISVSDDFFDGLVGDAYVGAEFLDGEDLVFFLIECFLNSDDQTAAVALTFTGNELDVLGVDADSGGSGFHRFGFPYSAKFGKQNETVSVGVR